MANKVKSIKISLLSLILSVFTVVAYHIPFFTYSCGAVEKGFNGIIIVASLALLLLAADFFLYYLLLFLGRIVGKCIIVFTLISNAGSLYFINSYNVLITDEMMGNVFNTQYSEASGFLSVGAVLYILLLGVLPSVLLFLPKVEYGSVKRLFANIGIALAAVLGVALANMQNWPWIDRNSTELGSLLLPWSYTVNSVRYYNAEKKRNAKEIPLPDAIITNDSEDVCILIIGESARRDHFSLYGYERTTNPLLEKDPVRAFIATSADTYTTAGVKAILAHKPTNELYEILPNYLYRSGVDVVWRTSNWGEPPVHIDDYMTVGDIAKEHPDADDRFDGILLEGLRERIAASQSRKMLIILHTNTSHGPVYYKRYPEEFEKFTPVCTTVEMSKAVKEELINAYDNTILYTDYLIHSTIEILKDFPEKRGTVIYVSDHGESLGENNLYMHGVPMYMAPAEQIEIPFIVWHSEGLEKIKEIDEVGQYHVFHSILHFMGIESPVFDESLNIYR